MDQWVIGAWWAEIDEDDDEDDDGCVWLENR